MKDLILEMSTPYHWSKTKTNTMNTEKRIERIESDLAIVKKDLTKPELETNKWYKDNDGRVIFITKFLRVGVIAYGIGASHWEDESEWLNSNGTCDLVLMTDKEVETALIKEAEKRGFIEGVKIITPMGGIKTIGMSMRYCPIQGCLFNENPNTDGRIFDDGKWAKIVEAIPELTMEEICDKIGYEIKIKKD